MCGEVLFVYGDVNGDLAVDCRDAVRLLRYFAGCDQNGESIVEIGFGADCNGDGEVDSRDATRLLQYLANYDPATDSSNVELGK